GIVAPAPSSRAELTADRATDGRVRTSGGQTGPPLEEVLGGEWRTVDSGPYFFVEMRVEPAAAHGRSRVGDMGERLEQAASVAPLVAGGAPAHPPFVFFDVETTGLAGGAGTYVFLIGCGEFTADGAFVTRQFLLTKMTDERPLLAAVRSELGR